MRWGVVAWVVITGCTATTPAAEAPPTKTTAANVDPPADVPIEAPDPAQWACEVDGDCVMTCALGSVSSTWLKRHPNADDCDDGCGWKGGQEACLAGECVALKSDGGGVDPGCTKVIPNRPPIDAPDE